MNDEELSLGSPEEAAPDASEEDIPELSSHEKADTQGALSSIVNPPNNPGAPLQMGIERLKALSQLKAQMKEQAAARQAAMERVAQAYQTPVDTGLDPGLIALGRGIASKPASQALVGFTEGLQGMADMRQKLAERQWAREAAAAKVRAEAEQQNMADILNQAKLDVGMTGYGRASAHIREYTNKNNERVQVVTNPYTGEMTQTVLGKAKDTGASATHLKAGFQWATNPDGTPKLDDSGQPMQTKIGTVPGSVASNDLPEKGWQFYTDGTDTFRGNPNAPAGGFQKQTPDGWVTTTPTTNLKKLGAASAQSSALNQRFAGRVIGASNEGLAALSTIAGMGDPNTGLFGSKAPGNIFARAGAGLITPEQAKMYNATTAGLSVEIATAQNQGMAPHQEQIKHVEDAITIQPTDSDQVKKYRVALAARYLDKALETSKDLASDKQNTSIDRIREHLKEFPDPNSVMGLNPKEGMFKSSPTKVNSPVMDNTSQVKDENVLNRSPVSIYSDEDYDALEPGTVFIPPGGGKPRRKPGGK